jgi:putative phosphoesterase
MRVAALYDIHGNLPALEEVLREVDAARPDLILVGGDIVPGPFPRETLERLLALGERVRFIRGNCERSVVAAFDGEPFAEIISSYVRGTTAWSAQQLDRAQRDILASWPETAVLAVDGIGDVLFCHGSPRGDEEILTAATPAERLRVELAGVEQRMVVCGHTHMQFDRSLDGVRVLNAGSVGMPYGEPGAYWLLLGPTVGLRRTSYDLERAAEAIRASDYPQAEDFATNNVLRPESAAEATALFERMAEERAG